MKARVRTFALAFTLCASLSALARPAHADSPSPTAATAPGLADAAITQGNISQTICVPGWSSRHRPPEATTEAIKARQLAERDRPGGLADYEEDHVIPLALGGAAADPRNLWPQPRYAADGWTAAKKDRLEDRLHALVCAGAVPLADAQRAIAADWTAAYRTYAADLPAPREARRVAVARPHAAPSDQCPGDVLVWVNLRSGVYHYPGERWYGRTASGAFMCERAAEAEGDRATGNGQ
jgi:hypothetical protein